MLEETTPTHDSSIAPPPSRAVLKLRDVDAAVSADVYHRSESRLTVRRNLPFLRVGAEVVDEDGRTAKLASVRVYVENDLPTLLLDLRYPTDGSRASQPPEAIGSGRSSRPSDEPTVVFGTASDDLPRIVSHRTTWLDELVSGSRRLLGLTLRVVRALRAFVASQAPTAVPRPALPPAH